MPFARTSNTSSAPRPAKEPPAGPDWIYEIKHDGSRILAHRDAAGVRLITRNGYDLAARFPLAAAAIAALPGDIRQRSAGGKLKKVWMREFDDYLKEIDGSQHHGSISLGLFVEELGRRSLLNYFAQPDKLIYALIGLYVMPTFQIVHRGGADRAQNYLALIEHRELHNHPIEVVTLDLASLQPHCKCSRWLGGSSAQIIRSAAHLPKLVEARGCFVSSCCPRIHFSIRPKASKNGQGGRLMPI